jgi:hypothetical protein
LTRRVSSLTLRGSRAEINNSEVALNDSAYGLDYVETEDGEEVMDNEGFADDDEMTAEEKLLQKSILKNLITGSQMTRDS